MNIGERIKNRRLELGMSQDELARKVGYKSRSSINKIELARNIPITKVSKMAIALDTTEADLMGWNDSNNETDHEQKEYYLNDESIEAAQFLYDNPEYKVLFDATRNVKPEDIQFVKEMIDRLSNKTD